MLGGADNPNGELLSYIIGADTGPVPARPRGVMPASKPSGARFILSAQVELLRA